MILYFLGSNKKIFNVKAKLWNWNELLFQFIKQRFFKID